MIPGNCLNPVDAAYFDRLKGQLTELFCRFGPDIKRRGPFSPDRRVQHLRWLRRALPSL